MCPVDEIRDVRYSGSEGSEEVASQPSLPPIPPQPSGEADRLVALSCPSCATPTTLDPSRRDADGFCPKCDFPLFWVSSEVGGFEQATDGSSLRRLPGTAGRHALAAISCPSCTEPNPPANAVCLRCGAELRPRPAPPPPPPPPPAAPEPAPEPVVRTNWWPYVIAALVAIALIVSLLIAYG